MEIDFVNEIRKSKDNEIDFESEMQLSGAIPQILGGIEAAAPENSFQIQSAPQQQNLNTTGNEQQPPGAIGLQNKSLEGSVNSILSQATKDIDLPFFSLASTKIKKRSEEAKKLKPKEYEILKVLQDKNLSVGKKLNQLEKLIPGAKIDTGLGKAVITLPNGVSMDVFQSSRSFTHRPKREHNLEVFNPDNLPFLSTKNIVVSAGMLFANDPIREKNILKNNIPGSKFSQDRFGNWIIKYTDKDGKERTEYVNSKGFTGQDFAKIAAQTPIFMRTGGMTGLVRSKLGQIGLASFAAGSTSAGIDLVSKGLGSEKGIDFERAAITAFFAGTMQSLQPFFSRFFKNKSYIDNDGKLTEAGRREAKKAGLDPDDFQQSIDEAKIGLLDDIINNKTSTTKTFGIPLTRGQATQNPRQLTDEEFLRKGAFGSKSQKIMEDFDKNVQGPAIDKATNQAREALSQGRKKAIEDELEASAIMTSGIRERADNLRQQISEAYEFAEMQGGALKKGAFNEANKIIQEMFKRPLKSKGKILYGGNEFPLDKEITPRTLKALDELNKLNKVLQSKTKPQSSILDKEGKPFVIDGKDKFDGIDLSNVFTYQKMLNRLLNGAKGEDIKGLMMIKSGIDKWLDKVTDAALLKGNVKALESMKAAKALRAQFGRKFEPVINKSGQSDPIGKKLQQLVNDDINDGQLVNWIYGSSKLGTNNLSVRFIRRIKEIVGEGSPEWNALRQAGFLRLEQNAIKGDKIQKGKLISSINDAIYGKGKEVTKELYSASEIKMLDTLRKELQLASPELKNPSGTAGSIAAMVTSFMERFGAAKALGGAATGNMDTMTTGGGFMVVSALARFFSGGRARSAIKGTQSGEVPQAIKSLPVGIGARATTIDKTNEANDQLNY